MTPMEDTDLELPSCNPTYYDKVLVEPSLNVVTYVWETPHQPKNLIFLNHGLNGNIMAYEYFAQSVSQKTGTIVVGHDTRHFGRSDGVPRGIIKCPNKLCDDLEKVIEWGLSKYGRDLNVFLFGLSLGGRVVVEVVSRKKFPYKGAILVAPAMQINPLDNFSFGLKDYFKMMFMPESGLFEPSYTSGCRHREFINSKVKSDPYIYQGKMRAGTLMSMHPFFKSAESASRKFDIPYLFIQPGVDKVIDPFQIRDFEKWSLSSDKTHYFSKDMWHACCFDQEFLEMTPEIIRWLESRSE